ncbi:hypothetical protein HanRHA438_Chr14g0637241 [Helianthus annuus]|uniref:Uncharacterized protein n=1 Tax=Helianthus annuus TaxID=4232 RepID=A0A9K3H571_HELAN|nr:hypothetical protein HanXRQr2_Chr14g0627411 [Helianthus annuus]KAJ0467061.1 hypothetical protein HanIR_Chr14g0679061 [Helianthus annuus]KAJ0852362.1 hypothetical protein HanRHA438_Chr14g0637241 [Helianthus annuus]
MEGTKQKVVLSILVAKSRGIWGKSGKIRKGQMAKPRVLAITGNASEASGRQAGADTHMKGKL